VTSAISASTSPLLASSTTTALSILAQLTADTAQNNNARELSLISTQIQNQLNAKIAALQPPTDTAIANAAQAQITALQSQNTTYSGIATTAGGNATILSDLQTQLAALQTAAGSGNSAGFDAALSGANTDVYDLTGSALPAPFQPDQVAALQGNGLGIGNSASYDLSTPAGQAAAAQAVTSAQTLVGQIFAATTSNQILATDLTASLTSQINTLTSQQQQTTQSDQTQVQTEISNLTEQAQNQTHLIELALGNTSSVATALAAAENPPQPYTSVFQALAGSAATTAGSTAATAPAILSLFA
jgi:hypothetical protein